MRSLFTAKRSGAFADGRVAAAADRRPQLGAHRGRAAAHAPAQAAAAAFHGEAVERYTEMIAEAAEREIDSWPIGTPFALAPRMQAITST